MNNTGLCFLVQFVISKVVWVNLSDRGKLAESNVELYWLKHGIKTFNTGLDALGYFYVECKIFWNLK